VASVEAMADDTPVIIRVKTSPTDRC
jgi:hypothetical protein